MSASTVRLLMRWRSMRTQKSYRLLNGPPSSRARITASTAELALRLDGTQPVADHLVGDRLEAVVAAVHVRRLEGDAEVLLRVFEQHLELVGVVHFHASCWRRRIRPCSEPSSQPVWYASSEYAAACDLLKP